MTNTKEIWKDVTGFEEYYLVSNHGRIKSKDRHVNTCGKNKKIFTKRKIKGKILKLSIDSAGYKRVDLKNAVTGIRKNALVHRLVALEFIKNKNNKPCVNHIDGNKINNHFLNLEWCTHKENMHHAFKNGYMVKFNGTEKGEKCPSSKLKDNDVFEIKRRLLSGETLKKISKDYPVSESAISEIKAGRSWAHIKINNGDQCFDSLRG